MLSVPPNTTTVYTKHNDIAHFSCTTRAQTTISWKKERRDVKNDDFGVAILSMTNGGDLESHLLIAVTDDDLRGKYECFSSADPDAAKETFFIGSKKTRYCYCFHEVTVSQRCKSHFASTLGYSR